MQAQEDKILKKLLEYQILFKKNGYYGLCRDHLLLIKDYLKTKEELCKKSLKTYESRKKISFGEVII